MREGELLFYHVVYFLLSILVLVIVSLLNYSYRNISSRFVINSLIYCNWIILVNNVSWVPGILFNYLIISFWIEFIIIEILLICWYSLSGVMSFSWFGESLFLIYLNGSSSLCLFISSTACFILLQIQRFGEVVLQLTLINIFI